MAFLPLTVPQGATETLASFASRLGATQSECMTLQAFLTDMEVQLSNVAAGKDSAVAAIAELGRADSDQLRRFTPARPRAGFVMLSGEELPTAMCIRNDVRICPACFRDDGVSDDPTTYLAAYG